MMNLRRMSSYNYHLFCIPPSKKYSPGLSSNNCSLNQSIKYTGIPIIRYTTASKLPSHTTNNFSLKSRWEGPTMPLNWLICYPNVSNASPRKVSTSSQNISLNFKISSRQAQNTLSALNFLKITPSPISQAKSRALISALTKRPKN